MDKQVLFALDIGTRSVVGIIGRQGAAGLEIIAHERQEHHTRSMLDGQIHDVPEVAQVLAEVKTKLEEKHGPLCQVAVAAAGRSLCTVRSQAELEVAGRGPLTIQDERTLELSAIQSAQRQLATSNAVPDPAAYYCVGYSVAGFSLDGTKLISLVGQRGKTATIDLIATFLPRQVIDSMQSALAAAGMEMSTLTLEPIAAINVLIPATMRHLNLVLVDVGAGTSDVAITRSGSVVAYGMVPSAGDEITEAISQHYLLDFNVAESVKRHLTKQKSVSFTDVLGMKHKVTSADILAQIQPNIAELAREIASQIITLNGEAPQAVLLVGGGALTPLLPQAIAQSLDMPPARVAIRCPETVDGIREIPSALSVPDAVTPLGILKVAAIDTLHFITARVNDNPLRLFNLGELTVADALLAAGIDVRSLHGRPGMGLAIRVNDDTRFLPGKPGEPGQISVNGESAKLTDSLSDRAAIVVTKGKNGILPQVCVADVIDDLPAFSMLINDNIYSVPPLITVNGEPADRKTQLHDRDAVVYRQPKTVGEVLVACNIATEPSIFHYTINETEREYLAAPALLLNDDIVSFDAAVKADDILEVVAAQAHTIGDVLGLASTAEQNVQLYFNGTSCVLPSRRHTLLLDGQPASLNSLAPNGCIITHTVSELGPTVSDVLLAADFNPRTLPPGSKATVRLNGQPAEYTAPVKSGDKIDVLIK